MKLNYVFSKEFTQSMSSLLNGGILVLSPKTVFQIKKIDKKIKEQIKSFHEVRESYLKELSNKDEKGEPVIKNNEYDLTNENLIILNDKVKSLLEYDFEIGQKIPYKEIEKVGLNIKDIIILDEIIADPIE